jgi:ABC-type nitrate/sulfonate/bicarbonate transport system permease component
MTDAAEPVSSRSVSETGSGSAAVRLRWISIGVLVLGWELLSRALVRSDDYLAPPSQVVTSGLAYLADGATLSGLWVTTLRFLTAFGITAVVGVGLGLALGRAGGFVPAARDVVTVLYTLPLVPFYPLFVLWLGLGFRSEVAFGAIHGVVPVILGSMAASARVDENLVVAARAMGASRGRTLTMVVLPATVPDVVGSLRIGAALSLLGVLLAELMVSVDGVGQIISQLVANLRGPQLDAVIIAVCAGAIGVNTLIQRAESRLSEWRD